MSTSTLPGDTLAQWINRGRDMSELGDHFEGVAPLPAPKAPASGVISAEIMAIQQFGIMRVWQTMGEDIVRLGEFETKAEAEEWLSTRLDMWLAGGIKKAFVVRVEVVQRVCRA